MSQLDIFTITADQRYLMGEGLFLKTHMPMSVGWFDQQRQLHYLDEEAILQEIVESAGAKGNRLWSLYGAPGSGKSEMIKWLQLQLVQRYPERAKVMVRISRHELDPVSIIGRFQALLPSGFNDGLIQGRWASASAKPRTLTKLILLFALENLVEDDEQINGLFYQLLNLIEPTIKEMLTLSRQTEGLNL